MFESIILGLVKGGLEMFFKLKGERAKENEETTKEVNRQLERTLAALRVRERLRWEKAQRSITYYRKRPKDSPVKPDTPRPEDGGLPGS